MREEDGVEEETKLLKLNDFLFASHLDNVNFFKVLRYCGRSQISKKVGLHATCISHSWHCRRRKECGVGFK